MGALSEVPIEELALSCLFSWFGDVYFLFFLPAFVLKELNLKKKQLEIDYFLNYRVCIVESRGKARVQIYSKEADARGERGMPWKDEKIGKM